MRVLLAACRKLVVDYKTLPEMLYVFLHKTSYTLIHALYTHTSGFFLHISNIPPMIS